MGGGARSRWQEKKENGSKHALYSLIHLHVDTSTDRCGKAFYQTET